jgi:hypothetical protein
LPFNSGLSHLSEVTASVALGLRLTKKTIAPMMRASPAIPPNTPPTITPTGAVGVDGDGGEEPVANEVVANDAVVDVEEEGEEEAV